MHRIGWPGEGRSAGFDEPFEMLAACHERVSRSLDLLTRLAAHGARHGADPDARSAAGDVLRYFGLAAPHHHEDEERHVLPLLLAGSDPAAAEAAAQLLADHRRIHDNWVALEPVLRDVQRGAPAVAWERLAELAQRHAELHADHMRLEDEVVFPHAAALMRRQGEAALVAMGREMAERRGAAWPPAAQLDQAAEARLREPGRRA